MTRRPTNNYDNYHAHVYFDAATLATARALCREADTLFDINVGRVHEKPVGPHQRWSCQLAFERAQFETLIPWLDANRQQLDIFVHPLSGNDLADHSEHASWLGNEVALDLSIFDN
jgi:aromatic ring-cleaving dioxygenase